MAARSLGEAGPRRSAAALADLFELPEAPAWTSRYNFAPAQVVPTLLRPAPDSGRQFWLLPWGLIPSWAEDPRIGNRLINARAETVATQPAFHHAFRERRCLILAHGFYQWQRWDHRKQPFYIRLHDGRPFAFAGLWERWALR